MPRSFPTRPIFLILNLCWLALAASANAQAVDTSHPKVVCTQQPKAKWISVKEMHRIAESKGYRISVFKISNDSCYEIYGFKDGAVVEAYFDPATATLIKQNIAK
jgi:hypothetical protein